MTYRCSKFLSTVWGQEKGELRWCYVATRRNRRQDYSIQSTHAWSNHECDEEYTTFLLPPVLHRLVELVLKMSGQSARHKAIQTTAIPNLELQTERELSNSDEKRDRVEVCSWTCWWWEGCFVSADPTAACSLDVEATSAPSVDFMGVDLLGTCFMLSNCIGSFELQVECKNSCAPTRVSITVDCVLFSCSPGSLGWTKVSVSGFLTICVHFPSLGFTLSFPYDCGAELSEFTVANCWS